MKSWTYFISIPVGILAVILYWVNLVSVVKSDTFDALPAWIIGGVASHGFLVAISYHCYRTITGTWIRPSRKK